MLELTESSIQLFGKLSKEFEIMKVADGYFVKGAAKSISEKFQVGDTVAYDGRVNGPLEIVSIYKIIKSNEARLQELADTVGLRVENAVVSFISIVKENNKYESKETKMSFGSFVNMIETVQKLIQNNGLTTADKIKEYVNSLDSASDEYKSIKTYLDMSEEHCFTFALLKYDTIIGEERSTVRAWHIWDFNDKEARELYNFYTEFGLFPTK